MNRRDAYVTYTCPKCNILVPDVRRNGGLGGGEYLEARCHGERISVPIPSQVDGFGLAKSMRRKIQEEWGPSRDWENYPVHFKRTPATKRAHRHMRAIMRKKL